ncbi:MAG: hypothetical protein PUD31_06535 [Solobacterium sp.]|nr:hypothetical protein [Solobacterium sp.]MDY2953376.1 hypothetical protein [Erysipelotrichaceae bacterium]MCI6696341.1 hypothetical protein [Solobacterium sp.]MDD5802072.1 hypothetical protein [Solobacterium sp.]MDD7775402.1 hypothetical protein [Solobacterium sp.]
MKKVYSDQEIKILSDNPNVKYVRRNRLVLTFEFRQKLYDEWTKEEKEQFKDPLKWRDTPEMSYVMKIADLF